MSENKVDVVKTGLNAYQDSLLQNIKSAIR